MSLKKYYDILGLNTSATPAEVRKRYRSLAMRLHPDKNTSIQAKEQFLEITSAYEILIGKKEAPILTEKHVSRSKAKTHEDRIKEAKKRYYDQQEKEQIENEKYYRSLFKGNKWKMIKLSSIVGLILSIFIVIDFFLPRHFQEDTITHYAKNIYKSINNKDISFVKTINGNEFWITEMNFNLYGKYPEVIIEKSWIFHQPIQLASIQKTMYAYYPISNTFYSIRFLILITFTLPLITRFYRRKTIFFTILYHFSLFITPTMIILFLIADDHWAHLLTFGFL
jgi:hypothetical protein